MKLIIVCLLIVLLMLIIKITQKCSNIKIYKFGPDNAKIKIGLLGGVHGNEPAGSVGLNQLIQENYFVNINNDVIQFIVIPDANPCGLKQSVRYQPDLFHPDINRNFGSEYGDCKISKKILEAFKDVNLIIDFHEGWSWHQINKHSVGSTVMPAKTELSYAVGKRIVDAINTNIKEPKKQFLLLNRNPCDINTSLRCHMKNRDYILIEISGQNDIQPIQLRADQVKLAVKTAVSYLAAKI